ncbi:hypothetical protein [Streptomyces sp. NBC_00083]|uniref:hypothetical protein n=1 Tax=Streptomyces sp. NBC_00083 TaxID=2975647 RepID=UPI00225576ED|nr:hypothetical protein [Streptomyces sp. NBC_00083]MCX5382045.1 hypothetical protein [Streptomyces sp. NBC_00083]
MRQRGPTPVQGSEQYPEDAVDRRSAEERGAAGAPVKGKRRWRPASSPPSAASAPDLMSPQILFTWLPLAVAIALWVYALPGIDYLHMGDWGLIDKLPAAFYLSLAVLTGGFVVSLRRAGTAPWWPGLYSVALLFALKAPTAILYNAVRYPWASKHDAVVNHLLANQELRPGVPLSGNMAAYDQWPGFFTLNAGLVRAFGVDTAASYLNWAPLFYGVVLIPVLVLIYRTFAEDWRLVWTGVWIFEVANWVGQDYFSPQGMALILHLAVLAVVFRHFVRPGAAGGLRSRANLDPAAASVPPPTTGRQRAVCVAILAPMIAAINFTHQLTPVMLCVALVALNLTRRYRNPGLLVVTALIMLIWDLTMGRPLFVETLASLKESVGNLLNNSRAGYAGELTGPGPVLQGRADIVMVLVVAGLAAVAVVLRRKLVRSALPLLLVSVAPVPLFAVNDYGGEMLFRVYLFGLPGAAFFAAAALVPAAGRGRVRVRMGVRVRWRVPAAVRRRGAAVALPVVLVLLVAGFVPAYYGKERMYYTPPAETAMVTRVLDNAPKGSMILAVTGSFPQALHRYDQLEHWYVAEQEEPQNAIMLRDPVGYLEPQLPKDGRPVYFILTRTQDIYSAGEGLLPAGGFQRLKRELEGSGRFRVIDANEYGTILQYAPPTPR